MILVSIALGFSQTDPPVDSDGEVLALPHEPPPIDTTPPKLGPRRLSPPLPPEALRAGRYTSIQVNTDPNGMNILDDAANEPSLAIDPGNPAQMVIGWRQFDTISSDFRQAGRAYSHDAGQSWTALGVLDPGLFRSDPVQGADADGNFYYYSIKSGFSCQLFKSTDGGETWSDPVNGYGGDKPWLAIDNTGGMGHGYIYGIWQRFFNCCDDKTFTRSIDSGAGFSYPVHIPSNPTFGTIAVGPDGEVYAAGIEAISYQNYDQFVVAKSTNAQDSSVQTTFTTTDVDLGGSMRMSDGPNPAGLLGQAWVVVDHSDGPRRGYVYVLCSVDPPGSDRLDVKFIRSTDGGQTWSSPVRVNDDSPGYYRWQWFGTMSVAPNGRIDAVWNDTRNSGSDYTISELYYSYSDDGGQTWSTNEALTPSFNSHVGWPQQNKLGDYYHLASDNAGADLAYAATFNGEQDVYFLRIGDRDCNENGVPDEIDISGGTSGDCNYNTVPDECERDCNENGIADECDIAESTSEDCNVNGIPDECEAGGTEDCNGNTVPDLCDIHGPTSEDCNGNAVPDECDISGGTSGDCNSNEVPDECDISGGTSMDCNENGTLDECDLLGGFGEDCQPNGVLDECEATSQADNCADARAVCPGIVYYGTTANATNDGSADCGDSGSTPDVWYYYESNGYGGLTISLCESLYDTVLSVHGGCPGTTENQLICDDDYCSPHSRVYLSGIEPGIGYWIRISGANGATGSFRMALSGPDCAFDADCNDDGTLDDCQPDCNHNGEPDDCDISSGTSQDNDGNGIPDECQILGDLNCDGSINSLDVDPFVLAMTEPGEYGVQHPECDIYNADCNSDGSINSLDVDPFVGLLTGS